MTIRYFLVALALVAVLPAGCGSNKKSGREARREQIRNNAEAKRQELQTVEGKYFGELIRENGDAQSVTLDLTIKDVPQEEPGEVDPVMVPSLTGYLKFHFGSGSDENNSTFISFGMTKAEFDPKQGQLDFVVANDTFKSIFAKVSAQGDTLVGTWSAPDVSQDGTLKLRRSTQSGGQAKLTDFPSQEIAGEYHGYLTWNEDQRFQYGTVTLNATFVPPASIDLGGTARLYFGSKGEQEFLTYTLADIQFNPIDGSITAKSTTGEVSFRGWLANRKLQGTWSNQNLGQVGDFALGWRRELETPSSFEVFPTLKGTYRGSLTRTNDAANLPERFQVSFITSIDLTQSSGIKVTGNLRFYLGDFSSLEYVERALSDIRFNFYTRELVASTAGEDKYTMTGVVEPNQILGILSHDALGAVADVEVTKQ